MLPLGTHCLPQHPSDTAGEGRDREALSRRETGCRHGRAGGVRQVRSWSEGRGWRNQKRWGNHRPDCEVGLLLCPLMLLIRIRRRCPLPPTPKGPWPSPELRGVHPTGKSDAKPPLSHNTPSPTAHRDLEPAFWGQEAPLRSSPRPRPELDLCGEEAVQLLEGSPKPGLEAQAAREQDGLPGWTSSPGVGWWLVTTTLGFAKAPGRGPGAALRCLCGLRGSWLGDRWGLT